MADDDCEVAGHCLLPQLRARLAEVEAERDRARENSLRRLEANIDLRARAEAAEAIIAECGCQTEAGWAEHERVRAMEAALARVLAVPEAETVAPNVWVSGYNTALRNVRAAAEGDDRG